MERWPKGKDSDVASTVEQSSLALQGGRAYSAEQEGLPEIEYGSSSLPLPQLQAVSNDLKSRAGGNKEVWRKEEQTSMRRED